MSSRKARKINRADLTRVVVTETLPFETPIIFSNDGFHRHIATAHQPGSVRLFLVDAIVRGAIGKEAPHTIPFHYKIRKDASGIRRLALIHPSSQWKMCVFYTQFQELVIYYCGRSPVSIRAPKRVASTYFLKGAWENIYQYKDARVSAMALDAVAKHSPSFFSYSGYDRLYKFFESVDYRRLEQRFQYMLTLDVSKCFDSIYTHSLSWATKDKSFTKKHKKVYTTFADRFDALMRHANHAETNGIVIGPEVSRVFAEIIFQSVDVRAVQRVKERLSLEFDQDYTLRRYVDDVYIFARSKGDAKAIYDCFADVLLSFNLHANSLKSVGLERPFVTKKSMVINEANHAADEFFGRFLADVDGERLTPLEVRNTWRLSLSFIERIKSLCGQHQATYDDLSSYLISIVSERVKRLVNVADAEYVATNEMAYREATIVLVEVMYFFYSVAPSVNASYKLATSITVLTRFFSKHLKDHYPIVCQRIYDLTEDLIARGALSRASGVESLVNLEFLNVLLAQKECGRTFCFPEHLVADIFLVGNRPSYWQIIAGLYYVGSDSRYAALRAKLLIHVSDRLADLSTIDESSEQTHLLLDCLSCPHIDDRSKRLWISALYATKGRALPPGSEIDSFIAESSSWPWFIDWTDLDLLNSLEKKELKRAY
jgi:hypothetical protein